MKLIVGLGNPGDKYKTTRHNVGFMVLDELAKTLDLSFQNNEARKVIFAKRDDLELIKPQTFMNNSGQPLPEILNKHKVKSQDTLIVFDDIDMEVGKIRYRDSGSSGGHKGMQSIIDSLRTENIPRIKIGIGRSQVMEPDQYVTTKFTSEELNKIKTAIPEAIKLIKEKFLEP